MPKRAKLALLAVLTVALVASLAGVALAAVPPSGGWTDLSYSIVGKYGITLEQVGMISDGYTDGSWRPWNNIPRNQFTKMAVDAYKIPLKNPATPSFSDVPASDIYYQYIEGAKAVGLINGVGGGKFAPDATITREQAAAIIVRWVAQKNGYDPATMYSDAEAASILAVFPDGASVSSSLKKEIAFAVDFGVIWGTADGKLAPAATMTRIQGAAMIIRSWAIIPTVEPEIPADIALVSENKAENLIGIVHTATFKVTDDAGLPVEGALVDFDAITDPWYVGNVQPEAGLTDENGEVTVNLISTEIGVQRMSASVRGAAGAIYTTYVTKYWVALDEVYFRAPQDDYQMWPGSEMSTIWAQNNVNDGHEWEARVVVYGPGPLSTSRQDFYNAYNPAGNPNAPLPADGQDRPLDSYEDELALLKPLVPRSLPGIPVNFEIVDISSSQVSVGEIVEVWYDGKIANDKRSAWAYTDADGLVGLKINSTKIGNTYVTALADYAGNPYPELLVVRDIYDTGDYWDADEDWETQPTAWARAVKNWIPHEMPPSDNAISPAYVVNNTGEVEEFTLTIKDTFGNPIEGYQVEWWIQGVGFFKTDGTTWVGVGEQNKDIDTTDAAGQAKVWVKSEFPGQTIVHAKVMDKFGLPWKEWNAVKQWYSVDVVEMTDDKSNPVGTEHTFGVNVYGVKYVYTLTDVNHNFLRDDAVLLGNREDIRGVAGEVLAFDGVTVDYNKAAGAYLPAGRVIVVGSTKYTNYTNDSEIPEKIIWVDRIGKDGIREAWHPLQGKGVNFFTNIGPCGSVLSNTPLATKIDPPDLPEYVGSIVSAGEPYAERMYNGDLYDYDAQTDANGYAWVKITSQQKGRQYVWAVVDYPENPQHGDAAKPLEWKELRRACATKTWTVGDGVSYKVFNGDLNAGPWANPVLAWPDNVSDYGEWRGTDALNPNTEIIAVQIFDSYGNAVPGWKVTFEVVSQGTTTKGHVDTYHPYAHFAEWPFSVDGTTTPVSGLWKTPEHKYGSLLPGVGDLHPGLNVNPFWNARMDIDNNPLPVGSTAVPHWRSDDDLSWGYTLNGQINFTKDLRSAAYTTLVLDETLGQLSDIFGDEGGHITSLVNVHIWKPSGSGSGFVHYDDFQVTKEWTLEAAKPDGIVLEAAFSTDLFASGAAIPTSLTYGKGPWIIDNDVTLAYAMRFHMVDQFGNVIDWTTTGTPGKLKLRVTSNVSANNLIEALGPGYWATGAPGYQTGFGVFTGGWAYIYDNLGAGGLSSITMSNAPAELAIQIWLDENGDNIVDDGEIVSNILNVEIVE